MTKQTRMSVSVLLALVVLALSLGAQSVPAQGPSYSVWLVRSSVFKDVPAGAFMPDRAFVPGSTSPMNNQVFFQLPVNVGVIKGGKDVILYDTGWKQQDYLKMTNSVNWAPLPDLLGRLGIQPGDVTKIVIGHGHWDHAGTLSDFPNAVLYVQKAELEGIEWALNYPNPRIAAVNTSQGGCARTPACGYPPLTIRPGFAGNQVLPPSRERKSPPYALGSWPLAGVAEIRIAPSNAATRSRASNIEGICQRGRARSIERLWLRTRPGNERSATACASFLPARVLPRPGASRSGQSRSSS